MDLTQLLAFTMQNKASDLHLSAGHQPMIRLRGDLKKVKTDALSAEGVKDMLYGIMSDQQKDIFNKELEIDMAISFGEKARFRLNAFTTRHGPAAVFRMIPYEVPTMEELELPPLMRRFAELDKGLVLVTGPTGSGKSTTLAAMVNHINATMEKHIVTIEDPVEYMHQSQKSLINHREVGRDTYSFARALKSALREDPDVILVGEMRDQETIALALTAAETGHLVLGTLHASSAAKTVDRIIDVFPQNDKEMVRTMLSGSVQGVISQTLLRRKEGNGMVAAFEVLVGTNAVRNLIRENQIPQIYSMIQTGSKYGMITMDDAIKNLLDAGIIDREEARLAMLRATDEGGLERADNEAVAALGGGKVKTRDVEVGDEGYSF